MKGVFEVCLMKKASITAEAILLLSMEFSLSL